MLAFPLNRGRVVEFRRRSVQQNRDRPLIVLSQRPKEGHQRSERRKTMTMNPTTDAFPMFRGGRNAAETADATRPNLHVVQVEREPLWARATTSPWGSRVTPPRS